MENGECECKWKKSQQRKATTTAKKTRNDVSGRVKEIANDLPLCIPLSIASNTKKCTFFYDLTVSCMLHGIRESNTVVKPFVTLAQS